MQHELHVGTQWIGIAMMGLSAGMVLGAFVNRTAQSRLEGGLWLTVSAILQGIPPILLSFSRNPIEICIIQMVIGILIVAWNVQAVSLRQALIPNALLGRSTSVFRMIAWIFIPLGDALAGVISQAFGTPVYFRGAACVLFFVAALAVRLTLHRVLPQQRTRLDAPHITSPRT